MEYRDRDTIGDTIVPGSESIPTPAHTLRQYRACVVENVHGHGVKYVTPSSIVLLHHMH